MPALIMEKKKTKKLTDILSPEKICPANFTVFKMIFAPRYISLYISLTMSHRNVFATFSNYAYSSLIRISLTSALFIIVSLTLV